MDGPYRGTQLPEFAPHGTAGPGRGRAEVARLRRLGGRPRRTAAVRDGSPRSARLPAPVDRHPPPPAVDVGAAGPGRAPGRTGRDACGADRPAGAPDLAGTGDAGHVRERGPLPGPAAVFAPR